MLEPEPLLPVAAVYSGIAKTWTVTFSEPILRTNGPYVLNSWKFRRNGAMVTPDSGFLLGGNIVFQHGLFDGLEIAVRYFGPPAAYGNHRWKLLDPFPWFYYP